MLQVTDMQWFNFHSFKIPMYKRNSDATLTVFLLAVTTPLATIPFIRRELPLTWVPSYVMSRPLKRIYIYIHIIILQTDWQHSNMCLLSAIHDMDRWELVHDIIRDGPLQWFIHIHKLSLKSLKGHRHDWWCLFTISFFPKLLYISSMKPSQNRTTISKLIVQEIELHAAFEERENKQKNAKF